MINKVTISKQAKKDIIKIPRHIVEALAIWIDDVEDRGLHEVRKISGYHDEPLVGIRKGQRSIRLSRAYRAIYILKTDNSIEFIYIEEVNKHEY